MHTGYTYFDNILGRNFHRVVRSNEVQAFSCQRLLCAISRKQSLYFTSLWMTGKYPAGFCKYSIKCM